MKKPINQMSLTRLMSTKANAQKNIERHKESGNDRLVRYYEAMLRKVELTINIRQDESKFSNPKQVKKLQKELHDQFKDILNSEYDHSSFTSFMNTIRTHIQNRTFL